MDDLRMSINFYNADGTINNTITSVHTIPNLAVGQILVLDHPNSARCLAGRITNIQHVVYLGAEAPLTYVDVKIGDVD